MNITGIIAEYNPFHKGHAYQIKTLKEQYKSDYIIVAMSGNFVQRGTIAFTDKYERARMALTMGADLVLELPTLWSTSSAEYFAAAGVNLLNNTGVVTHLCFGAETDDLSSLKRISECLLTQKEEISSIITAHLKKGVSFPVARQRALEHFLFDIPCQNILTSSNNILAIEYLKALHGTNIEPLLIQRVGDSYHQTNISSPFASATAIRQAIHSPKAEGILNYVPEELLAQYEALLANEAYLSENAISQMLYYRLWNASKEELLSISDCNAALAGKIQKGLSDYKDFTSFCDLLKSKDITYTRISRVLLHALLHITQEDYIAYKEENYCPYLRVLGFRKESADLLKLIKGHSSCPIVTKVADAKNYLPPKSLELLNNEIHYSDLYNRLLYTKKGWKNPNDFSHPIIIL